MAITKLTEGKYAGLSTDIKPLSAKYGASFYEYDTETLWDKKVGHIPDNGWKLRTSPSSASAEDANSLGGKIVTIMKDGFPLLVIKAGANKTIFQQGDLVIGQRTATEFIIGLIKNPTFNTNADLHRLGGGSVFTP